MMLYPLLHYENEKIWLDGDVLKNLYRVATERVDKMERDVYAMIGGQINLNSPVQVAQAFERLGIDTGERTSKGTMSVGIKILADLPKEYVEKFPALKSYINYKKTAKLLSSYIKPLMKEYESRGYCRFAYKTTEVPCLTEDNYVYIKSKGLISIKDVEVDDLIWTQYGYKKVLWNNKKWSDEIYRLTLKNGTQLIGTGHHPVLLNTSNNLSDLSLSWSGISSTNVGDIVVCNSHSIENEDTLVSLPSYVCEGRKEVTIPKVMDKKLARLVGFLDGDGCLLSDRVKLAFNTKETEIIEYYISLMSEVFNIESGKLYHSPNSNSSDCCFFSTDIVRFLKSINVRQKLSDTVSEYIKNSSYDIWVEYLCGLFDSDGCLLKSKDLFVPSVKGIKSGMIKDVHQMLLFLGINSSLHIRPSSEGNKTQYEIRVTGDRGRGYFRDIIGKNVVHNMRRDRAINNKVSAFYDIHVNSVASVEKCLNVGDYVYDIEVEDVHEYIANGIVTHNTGRLACGKDGKNSFFSPINAQSLPKPHVKMEDVFDLGDRNLFSKKDNIIMGYKFVYSSYDEEGKHIVPEDSTYIGWVEGMDDDLNLRMAISPKMLEDSGDDEFLYCSFDYAAEELRIAANLSREPNWVEAFTSGNDIHKSTACAIWGEEHYNRDYRKMAKYANFSILYGASSHSLYADSRYGFKSLQEAEDFYNKYKKALPTLFQWQDRIIASAKRKGMLQTFFGRPRRLRSYYENRQIGFANRSAGNTSVQGVAGDILKMVMIKLWKVVFNNEEFKNDVSWRVAIHDEIGYTIRATKLMRALKVIKETQSVKLPEWPVEIITDPSVGWSMGRVYDFHMVEDDSELGYHFEPDLA
jgi:DNA-directed DNA polymerase